MPRKPVLSRNARRKNKPGRLLPLFKDYVTVAISGAMRRQDDAEGSGPGGRGFPGGVESHAGGRHARPGCCRSKNRDCGQRGRVFPGRIREPMALSRPGRRGASPENRHERVCQCVHGKGSRHHQGRRRESVSRYESGQPRSFHQLLSAGRGRHCVLWLRARDRPRKTNDSVPDCSVSARVPVHVPAVRPEGAEFRQ